MTASDPIKVFYSYSHRDEPYRVELEKALKIFERNGLIDDWNDRQITAGDEWKKEINENLLHSQIIILLVSPDFINSDYCYDIETATAIDLDKQKKASVVPVIIRPCQFKDTNFSYLQALPKDAKPISTWPNQDEAWLNVSDEIKKLIIKLQPKVMKMDNAEPVIKNVIKNFGGATNTIDFGGDDFKNINKNIEQTDSPHHAEDNLNSLIKNLAEAKPDLYLTSNSIQNWATKQPGFSNFDKYEIDSIEKELKHLADKKFFKTTQSKAGDTMYKFANG